MSTSVSSADQRAQFNARAARMAGLARQAAEAAAERSRELRKQSEAISARRSRPETITRGR
jgi:hypothetical protein